MKKVSFMLRRSFENFTRTNYSLDKRDAIEFLKAIVFSNPAEHTDIELDEDAEIIETSSFSNGVLVKANISDWVYKALTKRPELNFKVELL